MKTLQTIIAITILSLFTFSCSNDGDSDTNKPVVLLEKETNSSGSVNYTYDAYNKLTAVEDINPGFTSYKTTFVYNPNGKIEESMIEQTGGITPSPPTKMTYIYDAQKRLIEKKYFQGSSKNPDLFDYFRSEFFEYSGNLVTFKSLKKGSTFPDTKIIYDFDTNGNIVKETSYSQINADNPNGLIFTIETITYDDKLNPEASLPSEYKFPNSTKNNQIKSTTVMGKDTYITDYVYEYNTEGYVTKRTGTGQSSNTYQYKK